MTNKEEGEARWKHEFCQALIEALEEKSVKKEEKNKDDVASELYQELCHDDPNISPTLYDENDVSYLSQCLLDPKSYLALSIPLIRGIHSLSKHKTNTGTGILSELEWTIFGMGPFQYLSSKGNNQHFLGSVTIQELQATLQPPKHTEEEEQSQQSQQEQMEMFSKKLQQQSQQENDVVENDDDSLKEIFAEESDDDDYDYSADTTIPSSYQVEKDHTTTLFTLWDPKVLSTCQEQRSRKEEEEICWLLLSELSSYSQISGLSISKWNKDVSKTLQQMTIYFLQQSDHSTIYTHPLMILRDCFFTHYNAKEKQTATTQQLEELLASYTSLLHTLLSTKASKKADTILSPQQAVGLSCLSSLCSQITFYNEEDKHNKVNKRKKTNISSKLDSFLMDQLEEIMVIMDLSSRKISNNNDNDDEELNKIKDCRNQVTLCLYPILSTLIHPLYWNTKKAQTLLSSGFILDFINFLLPSSPNENIPNDLFHTILWSMCTQSTKIIGKYTFRTPKFYNLIHSTNNLEMTSIEKLLWYCTSLSISSTTVVAPRLKLKKPTTKNNEILTMEEIKQSCISLFEQICQETKQSLESSEPNYFPIITFANAIAQYSNIIGSTWIQVIHKNDAENAGKKRVLQSLQSVSSTMQQHQQKTQPLKTVMSKDHDDDDEDGDNNHKASNSHRIRNLQMSSLRKSIKSIQLLLEQDPNEQKTEYSAISNIRVSSKTD